jgi:hypothetical protein
MFHQQRRAGKRQELQYRNDLRYVSCPRMNSHSGCVYLVDYNDSTRPGTAKTTGRFMEVCFVK